MIIQFNKNIIFNEKLYGNNNCETQEDCGVNVGGNLIINENLYAAIITPDKDIVPNAENLKPAYIVFENYEKILQWNRSLRFGLAVCTLKDKFKNAL